MCIKVFTDRAGFGVIEIFFNFSAHNYKIYIYHQYQVFDESGFLNS